MVKRRDPSQLLLDLARNEGPDAVHLAYTPKFEAVCQQINPTATIEDKHGLWEKVLEYATRNEPAAPAKATPPSSSRPEPSRDATRLPAQIPRSLGQSGFLFPVHDPISDLQPWAAPPAPEVSPEQAERRQKMLADIADSHLANREQKVAHILHRFPETRDSDTALCIRYWNTFQADVLERWQPLKRSGASRPVRHTGGLAPCRFNARRGGNSL